MPKEWNIHQQQHFITNINVVDEELTLGKAPGCGSDHDIHSGDEVKSKCWQCRRRKEDIARERWKLLAKTLLKPRRTCSKSAKDISVRRFTSFELVIPNKLESKEKVDGCWLKYSAKIQGSKYVVEVHHLQQRLTARELIGFNNTGNVCIWPSEEVLAYYLLTNLSLFSGKDILEVGGGMACLAGLMLAKYGQVRRVDLTDGNIISVENVKRILARNQLERSVRCFRLKWSDYETIAERYDVVLSSDCLFFDDTRSDLIETLWHSLRESGVALVTAPQRGPTLRLFVDKAIERGFLCITQSYYSDVVWRQHLKFKESNSDYDEDIHYPLLLMLTKSSQPLPVTEPPL